MFRIIKDGLILGVTENPTYIRLADNGCFILCEEAEAEGIAYNGTAYHVIGRDALGEQEDVLLEQTDVGQELESAKQVSGVMFVTMAEAGNIDAVTAAEHADLFAEWAYPVAYTEGQIRRYKDKLYKCVKAHTSQEDWTPDTAGSLWSVTADPSEEWPEWVQPVGAHDAYGLGDKVRHNEKHWTSNTPANVWEPGVYGWDEVKEE